MASTKNILGDDPFATPAPAGGDAATKSPAAKADASKGRAAQRETSKDETAEGDAGDAKTQLADAPSDAPARVTTARATDPKPGRAPMTDANTRGPLPPPVAPRRVRPSRVAADAPDVDYGPSIDPAAALSPRQQPQLAYHPERSLPAATETRGPAAIWKLIRNWKLRETDEGVDDFGRSTTIANRYAGLLDFLYKSYFRVETRGLGHLPPSGRALIVSNHSGLVPYDSLMIMHAVATEHSHQRSVRPLVEDFLFHFPYLGTALNRLGGVRACPENAELLLDEEQLVAVFPEGQKGISKLFRDRYQLQRFGRGGFIKLALRKNAPIIPTAVVGAEEIHPTLGRLRLPGKPLGLPYLPITPTFPWLGAAGLIPLPSKWFIAFGEPMFINTEFGPEGAEDRVLVNRLSEQVRAKIQQLLEELLQGPGKRRTIFG